MKDRKTDETITSLVNMFLMTNEGNDCYAIRYHLLATIFKIAGKKFEKVQEETSLKLNENELYHLQYNYEHYTNVENPNSHRFEMKDFKNDNIKSKELEIRIQQILHMMYLLLGEVLKDYDIPLETGFK